MVAATDTRTAILDAAQDLIQRRGANGMSYRDISEDIGIRKASIHYYFPSKEDLLQEVVDRYSERFLARVDEIVGANETPATKLRQFISLFESTLQQKSKVCLCGMLGAEFESLDATTAERVRHFYREGSRRLEKILADGKQAGVFRFAGDSEVMGATLFSFLEGALLVARSDGGARQFRNLSDQMIKLVEA